MARTPSPFPVHSPLTLSPYVEEGGCWPQGHRHSAGGLMLESPVTDGLVPLPLWQTPDATWEKGVQPNPFPLCGAGPWAGRSAGRRSPLGAPGWCLQMSLGGEALLSPLPLSLSP